MQDRCEPLVSVQRSTAADAVAGHLAWGILIDQHLVMVPGPLGWLHDVTVRFEVLLASARQDNRGVVERIGVSRAEVFGERDHGDNPVALLELVHAAQHHRDNRTGPFEAEALASHTAVHHDVWLALEELHVVPQDLRTLERDVLARVVEWEAIARRELIRDRLSENSVALRICCILHFCTKGCRKCPGRWW